MEPTYYVRHPDDTYSVAKPQPSAALAIEGAELVLKHIKSLAKKGPAREALEKWIEKVSEA